jgi:hypothetical protein
LLGERGWRIVSRIERFACRMIALATIVVLRWGGAAGSGAWLQVPWLQLQRLLQPWPVAPSVGGAGDSQSSYAVTPNPLLWLQLHAAAGAVSVLMSVLRLAM